MHALWVGQYSPPPYDYDHTWYQVHYSDYAPPLPSPRRRRYGKCLSFRVLSTSTLGMTQKNNYRIVNDRAGCRAYMGV